MSNPEDLGEDHKTVNNEEPAGVLEANTTTFPTEHCHIPHSQPFPFFKAHFSEPYPFTNEIIRVWTRDGRRFFKNKRDEVYSCPLKEPFLWFAHPDFVVSIQLPSCQSDLLEQAYGRYNGDDFDDSESEPFSMKDYEVLENLKPPELCEAVNARAFFDKDRLNENGESDSVLSTDDNSTFVTCTEPNSDAIHGNGCLPLNQDQLQCPKSPYDDHVLNEDKLIEPACEKVHENGSVKTDCEKDGTCEKGTVKYASSEDLQKEKSEVDKMKSEEGVTRESEEYRGRKDEEVEEEVAIEDVKSGEEDNLDKRTTDVEENERDISVKKLAKYKKAVSEQEQVEKELGKNMEGEGPPVASTTVILKEVEKQEAEDKLDELEARVRNAEIGIRMNKENAEEVTKREENEVPGKKVKSADTNDNTLGTTSKETECQMIKVKAETVKEEGENIPNEEVQNKTLEREGNDFFRKVGASKEEQANPVMTQEKDKAIEEQNLQIEPEVEEAQSVRGERDLKLSKEVGNRTAEEKQKKMEGETTKGLTAGSYGADTIEQETEKVVKEILTTVMVDKHIKVEREETTMTDEMDRKKCLEGQVVDSNEVEQIREETKRENPEVDVGKQEEIGGQVMTSEEQNKNTGESVGLEEIFKEPAVLEDNIGSGDGELEDRTIANMEEERTTVEEERNLKDEFKGKVLNDDTYEKDKDNIELNKQVGADEEVDTEGKGTSQKNPDLKEQVTQGKKIVKLSVESHGNAEDEKVTDNGNKEVETQERANKQASPESKGSTAEVQIEVKRVVLEMGVVEDQLDKRVKKTKPQITPDKQADPDGEDVASVVKQGGPEKEQKAAGGHLVKCDGINVAENNLDNGVMKIKEQIAADKQADPEVEGIAPEVKEKDSERDEKTVTGQIVKSGGKYVVEDQLDKEVMNTEEQVSETLQAVPEGEDTSEEVKQEVLEIDGEVKGLVVRLHGKDIVKDQLEKGKEQAERGKKVEVERQDGGKDKKVAEQIKENKGEKDVAPNLKQGIVNESEGQAKEIGQEERNVQLKSKESVNETIAKSDENELDEKDTRKKGVSRTSSRDVLEDTESKNKKVIIRSADTKGQEFEKEIEVKEGLTEEAVKENGTFETDDSKGETEQETDESAQKDKGRGESVVPAVDDAIKEEEVETAAGSKKARSAEFEEKSTEEKENETVKTESSEGKITKDNHNDILENCGTVATRHKEVLVNAGIDKNNRKVVGNSGTETIEQQLDSVEIEFKDAEESEKENVDEKEHQGTTGNVGLGTEGVIKEPLETDTLKTEKNAEHVKVEFGFEAGEGSLSDFLVVNNEVKEYASSNVAEPPISPSHPYSEPNMNNNIVTCDTKKGFEEDFGRAEPELGTDALQAQNVVTSQQQTFFSSCKQIISNYTPNFLRSNTEKYPASQVLENLRKVLSAKYQLNQDWKHEMLIKFDVTTLQICDLFSLNNYSDVRVKSDSELIKTTPEKENIMIFGEAGFGKTTLLSMLATLWAYSKSPVAYFKVCVIIPLSGVSLRTNFQGYVFEFIANILREAKYSHTTEEIKEVLQRSSKGVLLIFDDYDKMSKENQELFSLFLQRKGLFDQSTTLVTSRLLKNCVFCKQFDKTFTFSGFSPEHLMHVLKKTRVKFSEIGFKSCAKLNYLTGMPPLVSGCIWKLASLSVFEIGAGTALRKLLDDVTQLLVFTFFTKTELNSDPNASKDVYTKLGRLFFVALIRRQCRFEQKFMHTLLRVGIEFIKKCSIMSKESDSSCVWTACNKTLMVYFATKYLNHAWSVLSCDKERLDFLQNTFCRGNSTGDWVSEEGPNPSLYYVGLLPEIVLQLRYPYRFETATFEMYHDIEHQKLLGIQTFDSVNLLSRIDEVHLERYGFGICGKEHENTTKAFEKIYDHLSIFYYNGNIRLFRNDYEDKIFCKVFVNSNSEPDVSFHTICRSNEENHVDRVYLDFSFRMLPDVFDLLCYLMSPCVKDLDLAEVSKYQQYDEFVVTLLLAFLEAETLAPFAITCYNDLENNSVLYQNQIVFKIFADPCSKTKQLEVLNFSLGSNVELCQKDVYNSQKFFSNRLSIRKSVQEIRSVTQNPKICINLSHS